MENGYLKTTSFNEEISCWYEELLRQKSILTKRIKKSPSGKLHIVNSKGRVQYYLRNDSCEKSGTYISKREHKTLRLLSQKKYDEEVLKLLEREIEEIERIMSRLGLIGMSFSERLKDIYSSYPFETQKYIEAVILPDDDFVNDWISEEYMGKTVSEEIPVYLTNNGEKVRSKSELNIANALLYHGIPYKYEHSFELKSGRIVYPDFMILNVRKRKVIYWEHRGMMDDREYSKNAVYKNKEYMKSGLIPGKNLVITEETSINPLGTDEIDFIIKNYLL